MLKIWRKVTVFAVGCDRIVFDLHPQGVMALMAQGATVRDSDARRGVTSINMPAKITLDARPGSLGGYWTHVAATDKRQSAGSYYSHNQTYQRQLAA